MAIVFDATIGGEFSNSLCTKEYADAYASNQSWIVEWFNASSDSRLVALISATKWLETVSYTGLRCTPTQALSWPRDGSTCDGVASTCDIIPLKIRQAEVELAYQLIVNPDAITGAPGGGGGAAAGTFVSKQQLGDLVQEFSAYPSGTESNNDCTDCSNPEVILKFPWLRDFLSCYADISTGSGSKVLLRVRS
jgi:hypothetical protein